jgi:hypothetical protein
MDPGRSNKIFLARISDRSSTNFLSVSPLVLGCANPVAHIPAFNNNDLARPGNWYCRFWRNPIWKSGKISSLPIPLSASIQATRVIRPRIFRRGEKAPKPSTRDPPSGIFCSVRSDMERLTVSGSLLCKKRHRQGGLK